MSDALEQASLIMVPTGYEDGTLGSLKPLDGSGDFTFSRGSDISATRVNEDGYIEKGYENLLLQSNSFTTTWSSNPVLTPNQLGYDGSNDAWLVEKSAAFNNVGQSISLSGVQTFSVYAKAGTQEWIRLRMSGSQTCYYHLFEDGYIGTNSGTISQVIESIGNGWYRCSMTISATASSVNIYSAEDDNVMGTSGSIYIQDAMLNQGLVAYPYVETTTAPVAGGILEDMPRLDYSGSCPALLLEPQRTNVVPQSEYFGSAWFTNATLTSNYGISPEGVRNSTRVSYSGGNQYLAIGFQGAAGTGSIYVKGVSGETITIGAGSVAGGSLHTLNGDWQRVSFYDDGTSAYFTINTYFGTARDIEVFGAQIEQDATYPTSYIPTYGTSQTRLKDVVFGAGDVNTFNSTEGVLYVEFNALADDRGGSGYIQISNGTGSNRIYIGNSGALDSKIGSAAVIGGALQWIINSSLNFDVTQFHKVALSYKENDITLYVDGQIQGTDTSAVMAPANTFNVLDFRASLTTNRYGKVKQVLYFPTALSDDECIALTTIS